MTFQELQAKKILACYPEDTLEKGYTFEWRDVHGKTKTFQRRMKVKTGGDDQPVGSGAYNPLGNRGGKHSAELSDKLTHGLLYNGRFYNNAGERIHLSEDQLEQAKKEYSQKGFKTDGEGKELLQSFNNKKIENKDEIIGKIKEKDPQYEKHIEKLKLKHDERQTEDQKKETVSKFLESIVDTPNSNQIYSALSSIRSQFNDDIDPTFSVTTKNKENKDVTVERQLDDLLSSFKKITDQNIYSRPQIRISKIEIKDFDEYSDNDFKKKDFSVDSSTHENIYKKIK